MRDFVFKLGGGRGREIYDIITFIKVSSTSQEYKSHVITIFFRTTNERYQKLINPTT